MHDGHGKGHTGHGWDEQAKWYPRMADLVESEMGKATEAMLVAVAAGPGKRVLDLACGPGHSTAAARRRGAYALGIDLSPEMIAAARERFPEDLFLVADMVHPPEGPWDAIVCRLGVHHADARWAAAAWRVLRPGGRIAIAEWGGDFPHARERGMRAPDHWGRILASAGFTEVAVDAVEVHLGRLARRHPDLVTEFPEAHADHLRDRTAYVISATRP